MGSYNQYQNKLSKNTGEQSNGSIIDLNGNVISVNTRKEIDDCINSLPIKDRFEEIKDIFKKHDIVFIEAETGSGKSTQLPKLLAEAFKEMHGRDGVVYSTQPRVPAAIGLANRVSQELITTSLKVEHTLGYGVGYRTGKGKSSSRISPISFHTDGYELLRMVSTGRVPDVIILDEYHSESIPTIFLSYMLRELKKSGYNIKIVITSATMDTQKAIDYFLDGIDSIKEIPSLKVKGRKCEIKRYEAKPSDYQKTIENLYEQGKNTLIFAPGKREIEEVINETKGYLGYDIDIRALHGDLSVDEQQAALKKGSGERPFIIIATNIAEESLTIDGINAVIDFSTFKEASVDTNGTQRLDTKIISEANATQRAGRAGRIEEGDAYRLNETPIDKLEAFPTPPIKLQTIDREILTLALNGIHFKNTLEDFKKRGKKMLLDDPYDYHVDIAYNNLEQLGALSEDGSITQLGKEMLSYPLSVNNARILIEGINRGGAKNIVELVAIMENDSFLEGSSEGNGEDAKKWQSLVDDKDKDSDLFVYRNIFNILVSRKLSSIKESMLLAKGFSQETVEKFRQEGGNIMLYEAMSKKEIEDFGIEIRKIEDILETREEIAQRVKEKGYMVENKIRSGELYKQLKIALLSGYLLNMYEWNPKFRNFTPYSIGGGKESYNKSNSSTLNTFTRSKTHKKGKVFYIGKPFIIGGDRDIPLLIGVTRIEEELKDQFDKESEENKKLSGNHAQYNRSSSNISEIVNHYISGQGKEFRLPEMEQIYIENLIHRNFISGSIDLETISQSDQERIYLLINWLPYFLVHSNVKFVKFIKSQDKNSLFKEKFHTYIELIKRYLSENHESILCRINPKNNKITQSSFSNDSYIFDDFNNQYDSELGDLLEGKHVEIKALNGVLKSQIHETTQDEDTTEEIKKLQSLFDGFDVNRLQIYNTKELRTLLLSRTVNNEENRSKVDEIQQLMSNYDGDVTSVIQEIFRLKDEDAKVEKRENWVKGFMLELSHIIEGKDSTPKKLRIGDMKGTQEKILCYPILQNLSVESRAEYIKNIYRYVKKRLGQICSSRKKKQIHTAMMNLFSKDKRKYNRAIRIIEGFILERKAQKRDTVLAIKELEAQKRRKEGNVNQINHKIKKLREKNTALMDLIPNIEEYFESATDLRDDIFAINFNGSFKHQEGDDIEKRDFVCDRVASMVLNGDYFDLNTSPKDDIIKILERMNKYGIAKYLSQTSINLFFEALNTFQNPDESIRQSVNEELSKIYRKISPVIQEIESERQGIQDKIDRKMDGTIRRSLDKLRDITNSYYKENTYSENELLVRIQKISRMPQIDMDNIKQSIILFLMKKDYRNGLYQEIVDIFELIDDYEYEIANLGHFRSVLLRVENQDKSKQEIIEEIAIVQAIIDRIKSIRIRLHEKFDEINYCKD